MMNYVLKRCLLCREGEDIMELYPRTFEEKDLTPEVFSARRTTEHYHYRIVRCRNCGLVFSREILPEDVLTGLYAKSIVTFGRYAEIIARDYWRHLDPLMPAAQRGKALEIGCSSGFFLDTLLEHGFGEVFGVEPSFEAIQRASPRVKAGITQGFFKGGMFSEEHFDLVCSFQTLDHLGEPLEVLQSLLRLLKPGGIGYFITHNVHALQARILGERSPIIDVEHVYLFNRTTLRRLMQGAGFDVAAVGSVRNSYPLGYWLRMFPLGARTKERLLSWSQTSGLDGVSVPLKAGNIFVVGTRPARRAP